MKPIVLGAAGALACILSLAPTALSAAPEKKQKAAPTVHGTGHSLPMCVDCEASGPMSVTLCHVSSVTVSAGSTQIGVFSTGQSTSACVTAPTVAPDQCMWIEYHYVCTRSGFFGLWSCSAVGANAVIGDNPYC